MITIDRALLREDGTPSETLLEQVLKSFESVRSNLEELRDVYNRDHDITERMRLSGLPNNKLVHDFPGYIVAVASGYLVGDPVQYSVKDDKQPIFSPIADALKYAKSDVVDAELAVDASVYGKAVEICYANADSKPMTAQISPLTAFVVYDDTVEHKPLFGVTITDKYDDSLTKTGEKISLYTAALHVKYDRPDKGVPSEIDREEHYFAAVPIVEYWNNAREDSDFAPVMELINAYDVLQSDRVNDKQQFTDAIMVLKGVGSLATDADAPDVTVNDDGSVAVDDSTYKSELTATQKLRQTRMLYLPADGADAGYITKPDAESGNELLRKSVAGDIHKFSFVPDLTDENFAGNTSGVAMRFKLLGLEQMTKIKERWFREALRTRLQLFINFLAKKGGAVLDVSDITITFKRSLPVNELEIAQTLQMYSGLVPEELLLSQVPFVEDAKAASEQMATEKAERLKAAQAAFNPYPDANSEQV